MCYMETGTCNGIEWITVTTKILFVNMSLMSEYSCISLQILICLDFAIWQKDMP